MNHIGVSAICVMKFFPGRRIRSRHAFRIMARLVKSQSSGLKLWTVALHSPGRTSPGTGSVC
jgi:hypothetical protein